VPPQALEVVQIHEYDRHARPVAPAPGECLDDAVVEQVPVREAGQGIVTCLLGDLLQGMMTFGDLVAVDDDGFDYRVVEHVRASHLEPAVGAVAGAHSALDRLARSCTPRLGQHLMGALRFFHTCIAAGNPSRE
jgi:hypothetical protein